MSWYSLCQIKITRETLYEMRFSSEEKDAWEIWQSLGKQGKAFNGKKLREY